MLVDPAEQRYRNVFIGLACALVIWTRAAGPCQERVDASETQSQDTNTPSSDPSSGAPPLYLLAYDHGGLVLWGRDHFLERLRNAVEWLDRYPGFKIGLDNEAYTYDALAEQPAEVLSEIRGYLKRYRGRFGIGTCTYGQPLSVFINEESNIR